MFELHIGVNISKANCIRPGIVMYRSIGHLVVFSNLQDCSSHTALLAHGLPPDMRALNLAPQSQINGLYITIRNIRVM